MHWKFYAVLSVLVVLTGCTKRPACPTVAPHAADSSPRVALEADPDIVTLFHRPSAVKRPVSSIIWSADSARFAFIATTRPGAPPALWLYEVDGKKERPLLAERDCPVTDAAWRNEEELLVRCGDALIAVHLDGTERVLLQGDRVPHRMAVSPDGTKLAVLRDDNLSVLDLATLQETVLTDLAEDGLCAGCVPWLYEEEFSTTRGFGWAADSLRLWFTLVDERHIPLHWVEAEEPGPVRALRYPLAGADNPIVDIGVMDATAGAAPVWMNLSSEADVYLPGAAFMPGDTHLAVARLDRLQTTLEILRCDTRNGTCAVVDEEIDPRWVDWAGLPLFRDDGSAVRVSRRNGFFHLYLSGGDDQPLRQLTDGNWNAEKVLTADPATGQILFIGDREGPLSSAVFVLSPTSGEIRRLSADGFVHDAVASPDGKLFAVTTSTLTSSPVTTLMDAGGRQIASVDVRGGDIYTSPDDVRNELVTIEVNGNALHAHITRPAVLSSTRRYPVLVYVYGGPGVQAVTESFHTTFGPWRDLLARRGIVVFTVDNRGSAGRGREFEAAVHRNLTRVPLDDQLAALREFLKNSWVDRRRVGIVGWSFGGTMALSAALEAEQTFRFAVAVAPVTNWSLYDSAYTERYMQRPQDNPEGYTATDLSSRVKKLTVPTLVIHGLADDNVLPLHTQKLMRAFIDARKTPEILFYPGAGHRIDDPEVLTHLFSRMTAFIERNL